VHRYLLGTKEEMEYFGYAYERLLKKNRRQDQKIVQTAPAGPGKD
jgi:hypothetical protein